MEKTIIEGNKLIAEFMNHRHFDSIKGNEIWYWNPSPKSIMESDYIGKLKYHTSWDWLHPVVTKIKDYVLIENPYEGLLDKIDVLNLYITAPINTVWEQCVYAIKFINSQSKH